VKKQHLYFLLAFLLPTLIVFWWWGMFRAATIEIAERGPYRYAYLQAEGPYSKLAAKQQEVAAELRKQGITAGKSFTLILDDPRTTKAGERRARTGYLIDATAAPQPPLAIETIPERRVVVAEAKAHPLIAYGKVYGTLLDFSKRQGETLHMPTVEIYSASVLSVEMPLEAKP
jgi:effector-binding domain-containing protein